MTVSISGEEEKIGFYESYSMLETSLDNFMINKNVQRSKYFLFFFVVDEILFLSF